MLYFAVACRNALVALKHCQLLPPGLFHSILYAIFYHILIQLIRDKYCFNIVDDNSSAVLAMGQQLELPLSVAAVGSLFCGPTNPRQLLPLDYAL